MIKNNIVLIIIVILATFLRFFQLGVNPPSLTWDETAWGYNAYSIGIDGKDEFGRFLPHDYLESFGDFKPPMYVYLTVLPVKVFGLNEFSTRFASAFFGTLTVLVTYFLTKLLFLVKPKQAQNTNNENSKQSLGIGNWKLEIPIIAAAILAISPWHIMLSRAAFEANVASFFIVLGVWLFLKAINDRPVFIILSVASFVASIYTFNSARIVAPLLLFALAIGYWKNIILNKKILIMSVILGALLVLPIATFLVSPQASLRFKEVNIFSDIDLIKTSNQEIANDKNAWWSKVIHNRRIIYSRELIKHYFDNLSLDFLFIKGDGNPKFSTQDVGQMYLWEFPFLITGIIFLIKRREKNWWVIPFWLVIAIIPASLARETPHALRIEGSLPTFQILSAYGIDEFLVWLKSREGLFNKLSKQIIIVVVVALFLNILYFLHGYYSHYPREQSGEWQYGYKESLAYVAKVENKYNNIYFTDSLGRPYIYALFYNKYDPVLFRKEAIIKRDAFGFVHVEAVGKYIFSSTFPSKDSTNQNSLYLNDPNHIPVKAHVVKAFYMLNNLPVLVAYTL